MRILPNYSLKAYNTFGIDVKALYFTEIASLNDLPWLISLPEFKELPFLILGGGSNILFTKDYPGLVVLNRLKGISSEAISNDKIRVTAGSGVVWHELVLHCLDHNWGGIENLSLIPGTVGAAPIQNIGAYGVELKDIFYSLEAFDYSSGEMRTFNSEDCGFGYRWSIFKGDFKDKYLITAVTLELSLQAETNTSYGAIAETLKGKGITNPTIQDVSEAVIAIRQSKLPDPADIGNSGSFFKNPVIEKIDFEGLQLEHPDIPGYEIDESNVKVPAAWLIERCGWKGQRRGNIGVHEFQPLVLVNYGGGQGNELWQLALDIKASVADKFGILLSPEVNVL